MLHHRAFGRDLDTLVVAVVDNRRPLLSLMRAMLAAIGTGRIETYERPTEASDPMARTVPDLAMGAPTATAPTSSGVRTLSSPAWRSGCRSAFSGRSTPRPSQTFRFLP